MDLYELVRGPLAWVALLTFIVGSLYRLISSFAEIGKDNGAYPYGSLKNRVRSIIHWLLPFGSLEMRKRPALAIVTSVFHFGVVLTPLFLVAHNVLWYESWGIQWCSLPESLADIVSVLVILACVFFAVRRMVVPEVRHVSSVVDYLLLAMVALPFITGFLAYHQWGPYRPMLILHILSGEIVLVAIPFTKLSHMLSFVFSRANVGAEFGGVVNSREW